MGESLTATSLLTWIEVPAPRDLGETFDRRRREVVELVNIAHVNAEGEELHPIYFSTSHQSLSRTRQSGERAVVCSQPEPLMRPVQVPCSARTVWSSIQVLVRRPRTLRAADLLLPVLSAPDREANRRAQNDSHRL
jgi:hypothetical protein